MPTKRTASDISNSEVPIRGRDFGRDRHDSALDIDVESVGRAQGWQAGAAYLYILQLDASALAWEYLRRNAHYRHDWRHRRRGGTDIGEKWQLAALEDPGLDARLAQPLWRPVVDDVVQLVPNPHLERGSPGAFSLWPVAGHKTLAHDGHSLVLKAVLASTTWHLAIPDELGDGESFAYAVCIDVRAEQRWRQIKRCQTLFESSRARGVPVRERRHDRIAVTHMRCLQALDGVLAGASQREIAGAVFGMVRVEADWCADGELRAQTRHLIRRGRAYVNGDYLRLLDASAGHSRCSGAIPVEGGR